MPLMHRAGRGFVAGAGHAGAGHNDLELTTNGQRTDTNGQLPRQIQRVGSWQQLYLELQVQSQLSVFVRSFRLLSVQ